MALSKETISEIHHHRSRGLSIPQISLNMGISKSTVSRHVKGVEIKPEYYHLWLGRKNSSPIISHRAWVAAEEFAQNIVGTLSSRDLSLVVAMLYWAEGAKRDLTFINSDADMIRLYLHCLRTVFEVRDDEITVSLRIHEDLDREACINFWSEVVSLELDKSISVEVVIGSKKGKLQFGMCRVRVKKSGLLLKKMVSLKSEIVKLSTLS